MKCGTCKHWAEECPETFPGDNDGLGRCKAIETLPYAFTWAWREVIWTKQSDPPEADPCTFWSEKE